MKVFIPHTSNNDDIIIIEICTKMALMTSNDGCEKADPNWNQKARDESGVSARMSQSAMAQELVLQHYDWLERNDDIPLLMIDGLLAQNNKTQLMEMLGKARRDEDEQAKAHEQRLDEVGKAMKTAGLL